MHLKANPSETPEGPEGSYNLRGESTAVSQKRFYKPSFELLFVAAH